ncbi:hypothetical protein UAM5_00008 [Ralstonia phage UAM5]|nr:hypothetical protein UAM5_00008 [Ralstonia phage UAM5]
MKPFDYDKFQAGAKAITPDGRKVTFVQYADIAGKLIPYPVAVHIEGESGLRSISTTGVLPNDCAPAQQLSMAPPITRTLFVNVTHDYGFKCAVYETEEAAREAAAGLVYTYVAIAAPIEIEEIERTERSWR